MRSSAPRYALGVYCTLAGALMRVAPHRLVVASLVQVNTSLALWGIAHLVTGLGVLVSTALPTPRGIGLLAHLAASLLILGTAVGLGLEGRWTGTLACSIFVLALCLPLVSRATCSSPRWPSAARRPRKRTGPRPTS